VETRGRESALADSLTQAFLLLLERLTPAERAAFLLRTVFDYDYAELGQVLGKPEATVRQLVSRARRRLDLDGESRFRAASGQADGLAERFVAACRGGDLKAIETMMTEDVSIHSDGGGKASAARRVIEGRERAARFLAGVFRKRLRTCTLQATEVNGEPGFVFVQDGKVIDVVSLSLGERVHAVYVTLNPDKLTRWSVAEID
jgi:RNA polymerase sigma-70 factor (ECF subfamily)